MAIHLRAIAVAALCSAIVSMPSFAETRAQRVQKCIDDAAASQTASHDAVIANCEQLNKPRLVIAGGPVIEDGEEVFIESEGIKWSEGSLDGQAAIVGNFEAPSQESARFTLSVVDEEKGVVRFSRGGRHISRKSYWDAFGDRRLSIYVFIPDGPNGYGDFNVANVGDGLVTLKEDGAGISRFCCAPGTASTNAIVASFHDPASTGMQVRITRAPTPPPRFIAGDWIWRVGDEDARHTPTIVQRGSNLEIKIGEQKVNALLVGDTFSLEGVKATVSQSGDVITLENGMEWARATEVKARFQQAFVRATVGSLQTIDGPNKLALGDGALSVENHVNGMATMGALYIVNYPNYSRDQGRLLFWHAGTGNWSPVHTFSMASKSSTGAAGYPATMDSSGRFLVVATGDSGFVKVFDNFFDGETPRELEQLELSLGGAVENVGLAYDSRSKLFLLYANKKFWVSIGNTEADLSTATGWKEVSTQSGEDIPFGEGGTPLRSLGGGLFALVSLGSNVDRDAYSSRLSFVTLNEDGVDGNGTVNFKVATEVTAQQFTMAKPGEAGGAPSFRWGGTAEVEYSNKEFVVTLFAAPKRLDASGDYYKWSSR